MLGNPVLTVNIVVKSFKTRTSKMHTQKCVPMDSELLKTPKIATSLKEENVSKEVLVDSDTESVEPNNQFQTVGMEANVDTLQVVYVSSSMKVLGFKSQRKVFRIQIGQTPAFIVDFLRTATEYLIVHSATTNRIFLH